MILTYWENAVQIAFFGPQQIASFARVGKAIELLMLVNCFCCGCLRRDKYSPDIPEPSDQFRNDSFFVASIDDNVEAVLYNADIGRLYPHSEGLTNLSASSFLKSINQRIRSGLFTCHMDSYHKTSNNLR